jgi:hypothetical protein
MDCSSSACLLGSAAAFSKRFCNSRSSAEVGETLPK